MPLAKEGKEKSPRVRPGKQEGHGGFFAERREGRKNWGMKGGK